MIFKDAYGGPITIRQPDNPILMDMVFPVAAAEGRVDGGGRDGDKYSKTPTSWIPFPSEGGKQ